MWLLLAGALYLVTLGFDMYVTRKILAANPNGEINPLVRKLCKAWGPLQATIVGVSLPRVFIGTLTYLYVPSLFLLLTGAACKLASNQLYCLKRGLI